MPFGGSAVVQLFGSTRGEQVFEVLWHLATDTLPDVLQEGLKSEHAHSVSLPKLPAKFCPDRSANGHWLTVVLRTSTHLVLVRAVLHLHMHKCGRVVFAEQTRMAHARSSLKNLAAA